MKNVRRDARRKLKAGLAKARREAKKSGAFPLPKRYRYTTDKVVYDIRLDTKAGKIYYDSIGYDGTRCHTEEEI